MIQYIDKAVIVAEIEKRFDKYSKYHDICAEAIASELCQILVMLNTLEVEEVNLFDLNKEIDEQIRLLDGVHKLDNDSKRWYTGPYEELFHFARYFFELGLKAQKG